MENLSSKDDITEWIMDNQPTIQELISDLTRLKTDALISCDVIFHDDILSQYKAKAISLVGIEVCQRLGCSAELYYETIEDSEELWNLICWSLD